jgi:hypothetical protein
MNLINAQSRVKRPWIEAYKNFLLSPDENLILKVAPVLLLIGFPEVLASNIIPGLGEIVDLGDMTLTILVLARTVSAVRKYR